VDQAHKINDSLAALRQMYDLGPRYMTLTHTRNTSWADSATDTPAHQGPTDFGRDVVRAMNWLGILVDLSHVSANTMRQVLAISAAPVIFSPLIDPVDRRSPAQRADDVLRLVARNGGVVMVNFYPGYVSEAMHRWIRLRMTQAPSEAIQNDRLLRDRNSIEARRGSACPSPMRLKFLAGFAALVSSD
jgi:membrane dipeptidase